MGLLTNLVIKIRGDSSGFISATKRAESSVDKLANKLAGRHARMRAFSFAINLLGKLTTSAFSVADEIDNLQKQFGITYDLTQKLGVAFREAGLGLTEFGEVLNRINQSRDLAIQGNKKLIETFAGAGISLDDLNSDGFTTAKMVDQLVAKLNKLGPESVAARNLMFHLGGRTSGKFTAALASSKDITAELPAGDVALLDTYKQNFDATMREASGFWHRSVAALLDPFGSQRSEILGRNIDRIRAGMDQQRLDRDKIDESLIDEATEDEPATINKASFLARNGQNNLASIGGFTARSRPDMVLKLWERIEEEAEKTNKQLDGISQTLDRIVQ